MLIHDSCIVKSNIISLESSVILRGFLTDERIIEKILYKKRFFWPPVILFFKKGVTSWQTDYLLTPENVQQQILNYYWKISIKINPKAKDKKEHFSWIFQDVVKYIQAFNGGFTLNMEVALSFPYLVI